MVSARGGVLLRSALNHIGQLTHRQLPMAILLPRDDRRAASDGALPHRVFIHLDQQAHCELPSAIRLVCTDRSAASGGLLLHNVVGHLGKQAQRQMLWPPFLPALITSGKQHVQLPGRPSFCDHIRGVLVGMAFIGKGRVGYVLFFPFSTEGFEGSCR